MTKKQPGAVLGRPSKVVVPKAPSGHIMDGAPCIGLGYLFTATDLRSHREARAKCGTCPAIAACAANRDALRREGHALEGTWAGKLYKPYRRSA